MRQETVHYVQSMLEQMREEYRIVLVLRELEGCSYEEIAAQLSCSLGTVKSRISRARSYLKEQILADRKRKGVKTVADDKETRASRSMMKRWTRCWLSGRRLSWNRLSDSMKERWSGCGRNSEQLLKIKRNAMSFHCL